MVLSIYVWALQVMPVESARSMAFTALVACELLRAFAARSSHRTAAELGFFSNPALLFAVGGPLVLQVGLLAWQPARTLFELGPIPVQYASIAFAAGALPMLVLEAIKLARRQLEAKRG